MEHLPDDMNEMTGTRPAALAAFACGTPPGGAAAGDPPPRHTFSAFRAEDGHWTLTQREGDFSRVFPDLASMLAFARTCCEGDNAIMALREGRRGKPLLRPLGALLLLPATALHDLLTQRGSGETPA